MLERLIDRTGMKHEPDALYTVLDLPESPSDRPSTFVNMVMTADGKTLLGPPGSTAKGLGSPTDQILMRRLQAQADAAIIGASTLRSGHVVYAPRLLRAVVTRTGNLPLDNRFFTDAPGKAIIFGPEELPDDARARLGTRAQVRLVGNPAVDVKQAVHLLRTEYDVRVLALEGGASLNYDFFADGLVDELFLTLAPRLKGGAHMPTVVDGAGFPGTEHLPLELISLYRDGDELYLRYHVGERRDLP